MKTVVAKMNGLQVVQNISQVTRTYQSSISSPPTADTNAPVFTAVGDPGVLFNAIPSTFANGDTKSYLRQYMIAGVVYNHGNTPIYLQRTTCRFRRNVASAEYPGYVNLFIQGLTINGSTSTSTFALAPQNWFQLPTTSAFAQRYCKFGKQKIFKLNSGQCRRYSLGLNYKSPRLISRVVEMDPSNFIATGNFTKIYMWRIIPWQLPFSSTAPPAALTITGHFDAPYTVTWAERLYISFYSEGFSNPASNFVTGNVPSTGSAIRIETNNLPQVAINN